MNPLLSEQVGKIRNRLATSKYVLPTWTDVRVLLDEIDRLQALLQRIAEANSEDWIGGADEMPQLIAKEGLR